MFSALQQDLESRQPVLFYGFDLLVLDGKDWKRRPLIERKAALEKLLKSLGKNAPVRYSEHAVGNGRAVFEALRKAGGEGIVSKLLKSSYRGTRSGAWVKVKTANRQEFVIGGYTPSESRDRPFASLLLGTIEDGKLIYRGRVGAGFDEEALDTLSEKFATLGRKTPEFEAVPRDVSRRAKWVSPVLVAEVAYAEMTDQGVVRHAVFHGLRQDKEAGMAKLETPAKGGKRRNVGGVAISHPDREIFPNTKITKADLAEYYASLGDRFVEHAGNRPVSLLRCTNGLTGECFFQKHAGDGFPAQIEAVAIRESSGKTVDYITFSTIAGAIGAVQMGTIEFHIWGARNDSLEKPDRLVFDLDPDTGLAFERVAGAALEVRDILAEIGLVSTPMVTGGKGIHVICQLRRTAEWDTVTLFARGLATYLADREPDRYVATMSKAKRSGKIFIDWLRNDRGSTAIAPYSVRAREGGPVAVPVSWKELADLGSGNSFHVADIGRRLRKPCPLLKAPRDQSISKDIVDRFARLVG
jgi:bifunctional non-homologous end joining protein LigD